LPGGEFIPFHYDPTAINIGLEYFIFDKISIVPPYSHGLFLGESKSQTLNLDSRFYSLRGHNSGTVLQVSPITVKTSGEKMILFLLTLYEPI